MVMGVSFNGLAKTSADAGDGEGFGIGAFAELGNTSIVESDALAQS
jgi:hypothetical protein